jgi:hypothetical protein
MVRHYLRPTKHQIYWIWAHPFSVLTFPQVMRLHALVSTHYTLEEVCCLLVKDEYRPKSELDDNLRKCLAILLTEEGQRNFDEFKARKSSVKQKKVVTIGKRKKFEKNRQGFKRLSDPILEPEENVIEFLTEHERKTTGVYQPPIEPGTESSEGPKISI